MKRTYLSKRNGLLSQANVSWGAILLSIAVVAFLIRVLLPNVFGFITAPIFSVSNLLAQKTHWITSGFSDAATLALRNEELARENAALASENQALLIKEANLTALLDTEQSAGVVTPGILAGVVARPPVSAYDVLIVGKGSNAGVVVGMEAFGAGGVPLGVVRRISRDFSYITLFSASGMSVGGWAGQANLPVTIVGAGGGAMTASVSRAANIAEGDVVSVPGPGALPIGKVARIDSDPSSPSVTLRIQPALNPFSVTWVELRTTGISATATTTAP